MSAKPRKRDQQRVDGFNSRNSVGTKVRYWPGLRNGDGMESETRSEASLLGGHTPVVWVTGHPACIALTHIEVLFLLFAFLAGCGSTDGGAG